MSDTDHLRWLSRADLSGAGVTPRKATGLLLASPLAEVVAPLDDKDLETAIAITSTTMAAAGIGSEDRVVIALANDGELTGGIYAQAAARISEAVVGVGPRGRMRLLKTLEALRATVLVITPTGAQDFLARLHMEFLVDPLDLELRQLVLMGEISDPKAFRHLAREFGAEIVELFADPLTGIPVAHRRPTSTEADWQSLDARSELHLAPIAVDQVAEAPFPAGALEYVVRHPWHSTLGSTALRSGLVAVVDDQTKGMPAPSQTVGDHILIRGRWLSLTRLTNAMRAIDGITRLRLEIDRKGTLDTASVRVTFGRESLTGNPMWKGRIEQALHDLTPIHIDVIIEAGVEESPEPLQVVDHRGHHLSRDRVSVS